MSCRPPAGQTVRSAGHAWDTLESPCLFRNTRTSLDNRFHEMPFIDNKSVKTTIRVLMRWPRLAFSSKYGMPEARRALPTARRMPQRVASKHARMPLRTRIRFLSIRNCVESVEKQKEECSIAAKWQKPRLQSPHVQDATECGGACFWSYPAVA